MHESLFDVLAMGGWKPENYRSLHSDLSSLDDQALLHHFLAHGLNEGRTFTRASSLLNLDRAVRTPDALLMYGWSSQDFDGCVALNMVSGEQATLLAHTGVCLRYWRNDVANHLGVPLRSQRHGFVAIFEGKDLSGGAEFFLGGEAACRIPPIVAMSTRDALIEAYRHLESVMVYDELLLVLDGAPDFLSVLSGLHKETMGRVEPVAIYQNTVSTPVVSICAVALGNAAQLKAWLMHVAQIDFDLPIEICVLANGPTDFEDVASACRWAGTVMSKNVRLYYCPENVGFNWGVNLLMARAKGKYALITNTDVRYLTLELRAMSSLADERTLLVARQFNAKGALQHIGLRIDPVTSVVHGKAVQTVSSSLIGRNTFVKNCKDNYLQEVEFFGAAGIFADVALLRKLGPFDPAYLFAYHEDSDLALRARAQGVSIKVTSAMDLIHYESSASRVDLPKMFLIAANTVMFSKRFFASRGRSKPEAEDFVNV